MRKGTFFIVLILAGPGGVNAATVPAADFKIPVSEVVMRCDAPAGFSDRHQYVGLEVLSDLSVEAGLQLSLLRKANNGYDVLVGKDSLADTGKLSSMQGGESPVVHLVLDTGSGLEHFLFVQNPGGSGELLWSSATASALTTCVAAG